MTDTRAATARPIAPISLKDLRDIDPYPAYAAARSVGDVVWDEGMKAWLILGHDDCAFVERNEDLFAEPTTGLDGAEQIVGRRDFRSLVGDEHEAIHRPLMHAWRPAPIDTYARAAVRPIVADRIAAVAAADRFELFQDLARLLPIAVVAKMLGLPDADTATLDQAKSWMEAVLRWRHSYGEDPVAREEAIVATRKLEPSVVETVRERGVAPQDDAISLLWATGRATFPDWNEQDVMDNAKFLFEGGSETTAFLICNALHLLFQEPPGRRAAYLETRQTLAPFLEEVLRHTTVVHLRARRAVTDTTLSGVPIAQGERVIAINAAANRDPSRWPEADRFDPTRERLYSHLAFNVGPRHCVGAHLARMEASETIRWLFRVFPDLAPAVDGPQPRAMGFVSRAWWPQVLTHAPRDPADVRSEILAG